jgi:hypothetical protein
MNFERNGAKYLSGREKGGMKLLTKVTGRSETHILYPIQFLSQVLCFENVAQLDI